MGGVNRLTGRVGSDGMEVDEDDCWDSGGVRVDEPGTVETVGGRVFVCCKYPLPHTKHLKQKAPYNIEDCKDCIGGNFCGY